MHLHIVRLQILHLQIFRLQILRLHILIIFTVEIFRSYFCRSYICRSHVCRSSICRSCSLFSLFSLLEAGQWRRAITKMRQLRTKWSSIVKNCGKMRFWVAFCNPYARKKLKKIVLSVPVLRPRWFLKHNVKCCFFVFLSWNPFRKHNVTFSCDVFLCVQAASAAFRQNNVRFACVFFLSREAFLELMWRCCLYVFLAT